MPVFRYQPDSTATLEPWRVRLGEDFDTVVSRLTDRDRQIEDYVSRYTVGIATSSTLPSPPHEGQVIYETNTDRLMLYDGTSWVRLAPGTAAGRTGVRLRRAANQSISSGSPTAISWDTEEFDSDGFIAVTSTTATVPTGLSGVYAITVSLASGTAITDVRAFIDLNAGGLVYRQAIGSKGEDSGSVCAVVDLLDADSISAAFFQNTGGSVNVTGRMKVKLLTR